jgi:hypothetical protein
MVLGIYGLQTYKELAKVLTISHCKIIKFTQKEVELSEVIIKVSLGNIQKLWIQIYKN